MGGFYTVIFFLILTRFVRVRIGLNPILTVVCYILGIGLGVSTTVATVYTMEIATPNMRGRLAVIPAIGTFIANTDESQYRQE